MFTVPCVGMGQHGTIPDHDGEGSPDISAMPVYPTFNPHPLFSRHLISYDENTRTRPSLFAHPGLIAKKRADRAGIEGLSDKLTQKWGWSGGLERRCQLSGVMLLS